jgi:DNA modification methylase
VTSPSEARRILKEIDWSFASPLSDYRSTAPLLDCRRYHWYPATFIPEIPFTLIEVLTGPGDRVFDPFSGIGTTIMQAAVQGRVPLGLEVCRVGVDITRSLWTLLAHGNSMEYAFDEVKKFAADYEPEQDYSLIFESDTRAELLRPWFSPGTYNQLAYIAQGPTGDFSAAARAAVDISASALLKAVCEQRGGFGCIADNMQPRDADRGPTRPVLWRLLRNVAVISRDFPKLSEIMLRNGVTPPQEEEFDALVQHGDITDPDSPLPSEVDLIVASPPYPGMTDYSTSQRLSYYWQGLDPMQDLRKEIGARRKRFGSAYVEQYRKEMRIAVDRMASSVRPGGYACLVLPTFDSVSEASASRRHAIQEVGAMFVSQGFSMEQELSRMLPTRRRHHNQKWTTLRKESILVLRNHR